MYSLPFTRYKVSVVRTLKKCFVDPSSAQPTLEFDVTVSATALYEPDPSQTFAIDNDSLTSWLKTSQLSIERHDNGMLKSIGAAAEDRTGKVIVNTVSGAIKLAQAAAVTMAGGGPAVRSLCKSDVANKLASLPAKKAAVRAATKDLDDESRKLKLWGEAVVPFGKATTAAIQTQLVGQAGVVAGKQAALDVAQKDLQDTIDGISLIDVFTWPDDGITLAGEHEYPARNLLKLLEDQQTAQSNSMKVEMKIVALNGLGQVAGADGKVPVAAQANDGKGIRYRNPVNGALEVIACEDMPTGAPGQAITKLCDPKKIKTFRVAEGPVGQLGRIMLIPFFNGPFQSNTMGATFSNDGNLQTARVEERVSRGEVASDTVNQVATNLLQGVQTLQTIGIDSKTAVIKAKTSQLQAEKAYDQAVTALHPSDTAEADRQRAIVASDTLLKDALRANIEANAALEKTRAAAGAQ
jgi:hypothetical protein